jgi:hypothetical protein
MATRKVSLSLDADVLAEARERVGQRELSAYVSDALAERLRRDALAEFVALVEAERGPVTFEQMQGVLQEWDRLDAEQHPADRPA